MTHDIFMKIKNGEMKLITYRTMGKDNIYLIIKIEAYLLFMVC